MSLFTEPQNINNPLDSSQDTFRLPQHGCDVAFTHYSAASSTEPNSNPREHRCLIVSGKVMLKIQTNEFQLGAGEWFHIPANTEHQLQFLDETSLIEFWLDAPKPMVA